MHNSIHCEKYIFQQQEEVVPRRGSSMGLRPYKLEFFNSRYDRLTMYKT